ncbi:hypothetical protein [Legionella gresilensis]|uniref:hypothetical protein n=1 Tax=Legionella gresilensis TaxID=91823 RepID=UPI00104164B0|nr:hypothetical protein [Legionella gresilensis]
MLIYKSPLVEQSTVDEKNEFRALNSCWLYAPIIANSNSHETEEFEEQKQILMEKIVDGGISQDSLINMIQKGTSPTNELNKKINKILGLTDGVSLTAITGVFADYKGASSKVKREIYSKLSNLLEEMGPLVLEYPAFGFKAIHRTAITGILLGKNSKTNAEEIFFVTNDTMDCRIKAIPLTDFLEKQDVTPNSNIYFLPPAEKRVKKPDRYSIQEIEQMFDSLPYDIYKYNLKTDLMLGLGIDSLINPTSGNIVSINSQRSKSPNQFFKGGGFADEAPQAAEDENLRGSCNLL